MYCASALPALASFCSAVAASANFLRRMAVFTPSSGSAARENCRGAASAAPAASQPVRTLILFRVYQPVDHLGHLLAGHAELARRAAAPDRQQDAARGVGAAVGLDDETLALAGDLLDPLLVVDLDAGLALGILPEFQQRLLAGLAEIDLPISGTVAGAVITSLPRGY